MTWIWKYHELRRANRFIKSGMFNHDEEGVCRLVKLVHGDFYKRNKFTKFNRVVHNGDVMCEDDCSEKSAYVETERSFLESCRCLIFPIKTK